MNTYRVWLRYELFRGRLTDAGFQAECRPRPRPRRSTGSLLLSAQCHERFVSRVRELGRIVIVVERVIFPLSSSSSAVMPRWSGNAPLRRATRRRRPGRCRRHGRGRRWANQSLGQQPQTSRQVPRICNCPSTRDEAPYPRKPHRP